MLYNALTGPLDEVKFDENLYYFREEILTQKG